MLLGIRIPGQAVPSRYNELIDGFEGLAFGLVYGLTALGLHKRNSLARVLAMILVIWNLFGSLSNLVSDPGIVNLLWLCATIFVPICLFSGPIRAEFANTRASEKAA